MACDRLDQTARAPAGLARRWLLTAAAAAAGTVTAAATACGRQATSPAATREARKLAPASLAVWIWWPDPLDSVVQMANNFAKANPQITAKPEVVPTYWDKVQASLSGGAGPDIYLMNNVNYRAFVSRGVLADLTSKLNTDANGKDFLKQVWQPGIKFYDYKGKTYGVPFMMTSIVTMYNEDAVKAAGLKTPAELGQAWTWDTLQEYALKLTKRADETGVWGVYATGGIEQGWLNFVRANGGDYLTPDSTRCVIDQPPSVAAWEYLADLALKRRVSPSPEALNVPPTNWAGAVGTLFATGRLIFWPAASNVAKPFREANPNPGFAWNYALVPFSPSTQKSGGTTNVVGWVLNKDGKALDQSWAFLSHMLTKESQDILARADVLRPAREDSAQLYYDPNLMGGPPNRKAALEMFKWTTPLPTHEKVTWGEMVGPAGKWQNEIFSGTVSVRDGLQQMAAEVNALFTKAGG